MFNDVISGPVWFRPGEVKRLEVSTAIVAELTTTTNVRLVSRNRH